MAPLRPVRARHRGPGLGVLLDPRVGFPAVWLVGVLLAQIRLFEFQSGTWSLRAIEVMVAVPVAFTLGSVLGTVTADALPDDRRPAVDRHALRMALVVALLVGALEFVHQFAAAGVVPLLSSDVDVARLGLPGGPTVVLTNLVPLAAAAALIAPARLSWQTARFELTLATVAILITSVAGGRGLLVLAVGVAILGRTILHSAPPTKAILAAALFTAAFVTVVFFLRTHQNAGQPFETELYRSVLPGLPLPARAFVPLHVAIASNFEALAHVVDYFPEQAPFAHGAYSATGFDLVVPHTRAITEVSEQLTGPFVTVTVAGTLWADGGLVLVIAGLFAIGALACGTFRYGRRTRRLPFALLGGYLSYLAFFGVYTNLFTQHPDWVVMGPTLLLLGSAGEEGSRTHGIVLRYVAPVARRLQWLMSASRGVVALAALSGVLVLVILALLLDNRGGGDGGVAAGAQLRAVPLRSVAGVVATDGDLLLDNEPVWRMTAGRRSLDASPTDNLTLDPVSVPARGLASRLRPDDVDIAPWTMEDQALFLLRPTRREVQVQVLGENAGGRVASGTAPLLSPFNQGRRDVRIATYSGALPDLFVIDRSVPGERPRVTIFSGESGFQRQILSVKLPLVGLSASQWVLDVGREDGPVPDLLLFTPKGGSDLPEVHVLTGESQYQASSLQAPVQRLPRDLTTRGLRVLVRSKAAAPVLDVLTAGKRWEITLGPKAVLGTSALETGKPAS